MNFKNFILYKLIKDTGRSPALSKGQAGVYLVSSMTFLLGKYLKTFSPLLWRGAGGEVRFRQGKKDGAVMQLHHSKMVIFTTALPAGYSNSGTSNNMGTNAYFWTATENNATNAWNRNLNTGNAQSNRNNNNKTNGFSVRCLQNSLLKTGRGNGLCLFFLPND